MQDIIHTIKGETNKGMSFGQLVELRIFEGIQAKTAGLALITGQEAGLKNRTLEFFVNFIAERFPDERDEYYIFTWATRLLSGTAWSCGDSESQTMLLKIAKNMKLENIPKDWVK